MAEAKYLPGLFVRAPHPNAPDFVIANISLNVGTIAAEMDKIQGKDWVNLQIKRGKDTGEYYAQIDEWKPKPQQTPPGYSQPPTPPEHPQMPPPSNDFDDDIPF